MDPGGSHRDREQKGPLEAFWRWACRLPALGCEPDGTQSPDLEGPQRLMEAGWGDQPGPRHAAPYRQCEEWLSSSEVGEGGR